MLALLLALACSPPEEEPAPYEASRDDVAGVAILHLGGTPYDMGMQHAELFHDELQEGADWVDDSGFGSIVTMAEYYGLIDEAEANTYPDILEECQGLVDGFGDDEAWSMSRCLALAYGDPLLESISELLRSGGAAEDFELTPGCSQVVARGSATATGELVHGRNLDWMDVPFIIDNPALIVRHPEGGVPWVAYGFPGNVSPYSGMNAAGLALASNEAYGATAPDGEGRAHTQMQHELLGSVSTVAEVRAYLAEQDHCSAETVVASDATGDMGAFEMAVEGLVERGPVDDVVLATNHFVDPQAVEWHEVMDPSSSSVTRMQRLEELALPGGEDSLYGTLDLQSMVTGILRDTHNPYTGETCSPDQIDDCGTLANNGAIQSLVMLPESGRIYVAVGPAPVPQNAYVGFDIAALVNGDATVTSDPLTVE